MEQAVSCSPPTAGVPSSRLGPSMCVSWWMKRGLGRFFSGFLPFSPTTNFIPPFLHTHLIHFASFHPPLWWCDRRGRPAPLLFTDLQYRGFIASHPSIRPCVGHELRIFIYFKSRRLRWAGHIARMEQSRNAYRVLVGKPEGKRPLGRPRCRWEDNIKMDLREVGCDPGEWWDLTEDRDQWWAYVRAVMNLQVP